MMSPDSKNASINKNTLKKSPPPDADNPTPKTADTDDEKNAGSSIAYTPDSRVASQAQANDRDTAGTDAEDTEIVDLSAQDALLAMADSGVTPLDYPDQAEPSNNESTNMDFAATQVIELDTQDSPDSAVSAEQPTQPETASSADTSEADSPPTAETNSPESIDRDASADAASDTITETDSARDTAEAAAHQPAPEHNQPTEKKRQEEESMTTAQHPQTSSPQTTNTAQAAANSEPALNEAGAAAAQPAAAQPQQTAQAEPATVQPVQPVAPAQSAVAATAPTTAAPPAQAEKRRFIDITPYLKLMVEREGSDMYFTTGAKVQVKIDGLSMSLGKNVLPKGAVNDILPGILNDRQLAEFEEEMELDTAFSVDGVGRFRINVFRQRGEVALVIRQIKAEIPSVKELQLPSIIEGLIMEPRGLIIVAGATGTGKSTTVAAMLDYRNSNKSGHILTIEDPIEFMHSHKKSIVNQREVGLDTKSFKEALRRAMREAPDVIMIGEIRDAETMSQALSYADTGHLCVATLHATNTTQCMERIMSLFPDASRDQLLMDLSLNLRAVIAQRLLIDVNKKRVPATEILLNEPMIKQIIRDGETHKLKEVLEKAPPESPLHSFDNDMFRLYKAKKVTMEEALSHADEPDHFKLKINLGGGSGLGSGGDLFGV